ncbi:hypothetical protein CNECB9_500024 [Cupriavidus necator]|uniref:Carboxypeptidase regulatory-like domain-containing protein n=1 Tax=Cupriavidus necator TaxID=106590 RepID=A0A1K0IMW2_CUPNE|nr:hypothetical protein CNECB9_500024 [Cupriavidus necator]
MRGSLCGYVVRAESERPLEDAAVTLVSRALAPVIAPLTDKAGWFVLDGLPPGDWVLHASGPDGETGEARAPVFADAFTNVTIHVAGASSDAQFPQRKSDSKEPLMKPMKHGRVDGHVVRAGTGVPVQDASITVVWGAGPAPDIAPLTDKAGWFVLDGLPPGDWLLHASGPDGEEGEAAACVVSGGVASVTIVVHEFKPTVSRNE